MSQDGSFKVHRPVGTCDFKQLILQDGKKLVVGNFAINLSKENNRVVERGAASAKQWMRVRNGELPCCLIVGNEKC